MSNFLLELLVEEIPARFQANAIKEFEKLVVDEFDKLKIVHQNVRSFITPQRIIFSADLEEQTQSFREEKKGPQVTASEEVIEKFLKANNASREDCVKKNVDKKTFFFLVINHEAKNILPLLSDIIKKSVTTLSWKKSMHWGTHHLHFVRPIRNILAIFGGSTVEFQFDEIGLKSTNQTVGHRFMSPSPFGVKNYDDYCEKIRKNFVITDRKSRKKTILDGIKNIEGKHDISVVVQNDLLEEVIGLAEYPVVLLGKVPERFMKMPEEVITTPMEVHQKYFPTRYKDGKFAPYFVFVANNVTIDNGATIIKGNERVLNARLADALFFFETDLQNPLDSHLEALKKIEFHEKLGSVYDRVQRLKNLCQFVCTKNCDEKTSSLLMRTATLSKCDLPSNMVREFSELQGIMGAHYAKIQGEDEFVYQAIEDQYKSGDEIASPFSALFFLVNKIEIISSFFAIGKEPTGSKDPFALRRAAINIIKAIQKYEIHIDLKKLIEKAISQLPNIELNSKILQKIFDFLMERLRVVLKNEGLNHDVVSAVIKKENDILLICKKASIFNEFLETQKGGKLVSICRRAKNIIGDNNAIEIDESLLTEKEEIDLFDTIKKLETKLADIQKSEKDISVKLIRELNACIEVEGIIDNFFDKVFVNAENPQVKQNRLNMVTKLVKILDIVVPVF